VQSQTETVWRQADRYNVPRLAFINKLDRLGASFERVLADVHDRLGANAAAITFPNATEDSFAGIVDVIRHPENADTEHNKKYKPTTRIFEGA